MTVFSNIEKDVLRTVPTLDIGFAASLLVDAFGFNSPVYLPYTLKDRYALSDAHYNVEFVSDEQYDRLSQFGTPVMGLFSVRGGTYKVYDKRTGMLRDKEYDTFEFPVATIVDFGRDKDITKTPTIGSVGTVKEIFGLGDWNINIRGICLNDDSRVKQKTAKEQQAALIALNEIAGSLTIEKGSLFLDKQITRFVIESLSFTAVQGKPNVIRYEISAVSDEDFLIFDV